MEWQHYKLPLEYFLCPTAGSANTIPCNVRNICSVSVTIFLKKKFGSKSWCICILHILDQLQDSNSLYRYYNIFILLSFLYASSSLLPFIPDFFFRVIEKAKFSSFLVFKIHYSIAYIYISRVCTKWIYWYKYSNCTLAVRMFDYLHTVLMVKIYH
jgi:hypothetical protein